MWVKKHSSICFLNQYASPIFVRSRRDHESKNILVTAAWCLLLVFFDAISVLFIYVARQKVWSVSSLWGLEMHMTETSPSWSHIDSIFGSQRVSLPIRAVNDSLTYLHYKKTITYGLITPWPSSRSIVFIVLCFFMFTSWRLYQKRLFLREYQPNKCQRMSTGHWSHSWWTRAIKMKLIVLIEGNIWKHTTLGSVERWNVHTNQVIDIWKMCFQNNSIKNF